MAALSNLVALVTGASSGIGEALALELAGRGADVALLARRVDRLEAGARRIREAGRRAAAIRCDVTKDDSVESAVREAVAAFGRLDIVVANAGFGVPGRVESLTVDDYRRQFETNVLGVVRTVQATIGELKKTRGRLALMGSVASHLSAPGLSAYAMSKFAVRALADALREEVRGDGVSVTLISPGFVVSNIRRVDKHGVYHPHAPDPVSKSLVMPTDVAARKIGAAIAARRREAVITGHGKVMVFAARHLPGLTGSLARLITPRVRKV